MTTKEDLYREFFTCSFECFDCIAARPTRQPRPRRGGYRRKVVAKILMSWPTGLTVHARNCCCVAPDRHRRHLISMLVSTDSCCAWLAMAVTFDVSNIDGRSLLILAGT